MGKVKSFLGKVKTFVINHKKAVIAVVAVIGILAIGIFAFLAIRQATIKSALEAQVGGKWYMFVDMSEDSSWLTVELAKIENGKYTRMYHSGGLSKDSYYEEGSLESAQGYRVDGDSEWGWIRYGKGSFGVVYAKGENGEYLLYKSATKTEIFKEVEFSDYEKALTMFSCAHKNVEIDDEALECEEYDMVKHTCLDCGRVWGDTITKEHQYERGVCVRCGDNNAKEALMTAKEYGAWFEKTYPNRTQRLITVVDDEKEFVATDTGLTGENLRTVSYVKSNDQVLYTDAAYLFYYNPDTPGFMIAKTKVGTGNWESILTEALAPLNGYGADAGLTPKEMQEAFYREGKDQRGGKVLTKTVAGVNYTMIYNTNYQDYGKITITLSLED